MSLSLPFVVGRRLVDLVNELEHRLTGAAPGVGLAGDLAGLIPESPSYVLVLFDGLGQHQLGHAGARSLRSSARGLVSAPFPTTTTVSLATIATGSMPGTHGVIGHMMWLPETESVVNVLKWVTPAGLPVAYDTTGFLPAPNLWERLRDAGIEPITVQPADFEPSPLTRLLYRGCRFEGVSTIEEAVEATTVLSRQPGRFVFSYFPQVDYAAHVWGQESAEYRTALGLVDTAWSQIVTRIKPGVTVVGTADHGHVDYGHGDKLLIRDPAFDDLTFYGDPRMLFVRGEVLSIEDLAESLSVNPTWVVDGHHLWPEQHHPGLADRLPTAVVPAPPGRVIVPKGFDKRLIGYHGGLSDQEVEVPLLVESGT